MAGSMPVFPPASTPVIENGRAAAISVAVVVQTGPVVNGRFRIIVAFAVVQTPIAGLGFNAGQASHTATAFNRVGHSAAVSVAIINGAASIIMRGIGIVIAEFLVVHPR